MLDPVQQARIEALHRGFLYQHLFAVGCLLLAGGAGARRVVVERDEDVEVELPDSTVYVQVKTRSQALSVADVSTALDRFRDIREEHTAGTRAGRPRFLIAANQRPAAALAERLREEAADVGYVWPDGQIGRGAAELPPPWRDLSEATQWCISQADRLPYRMIASDSLVWKLTGQVALASSGSAPYAEHAFSIDGLPSLFEQLLHQLQDFPAPPSTYRPQVKEPELASERRLRIISGFSGAGKTSWAAEAAVHSQAPCAFFDAGETAGAALAASLVRELTARLLDSGRDEVRQVLLPGAAPLESMRLLDRRLAELGLAPVVVVDNAHTVPANHLADVIRAATRMRFVLLCQPGGSTAEIEALLGVTREDLEGWDIEEVAQEVTAQGCAADARAVERLRILCAGLPLFVQGACRVAVAQHGGDVAGFCDSIDQGTHLGATPQEMILERVMASLSAEDLQSLAILCVAEVPLTKPEVDALLLRLAGLDAPRAAALLRRMRRAGILQVFGSRDVRVHDAVRILGINHLQNAGGDVLQQARLMLKELMIASLERSRETSRIGFLTRLLIALQDVEILIDLMGEEMFHEMGVATQVEATLKKALEDGGLAPEQRFWAYDGLVFAALKGGDQAEVPSYLQQMDMLLNQEHFDGTHRLAYLLKRMLYQSSQHDSDAVERSIEAVNPHLPDDQTYQLIFKYNAAVALFKVGLLMPALAQAHEVIEAYFHRLGITPADVTGKRQRDLWESLDPEARTSADVKHLADALELLAMILKKQGRRVGHARIHAMKFYALSGAFESLVRAGQDAADDFVERHDFEGAREVLEQHVLPVIRDQRMAGKLLDATTQYAVILAYCGMLDDADRQMNRVEGLLTGATDQMRAQVAGQKRLIEQIRRFGPPPQARMRPGVGAMLRMLKRRGQA